MLHENPGSMIESWLSGQSQVVLVRSMTKGAGVFGAWWFGLGSGLDLVRAHEVSNAQARNSDTVRVDMDDLVVKQASLFRRRCQ